MGNRENQPNDRNLYIFFYCQNDLCQFRFPCPKTHLYAQQCPKCGGVVKPIEETAVIKQPASIAPSRTISALLDNIRSIHNVGSIFRTADGVGIDHLYLCGITSTPEHPKLAKAALGAEQTVGWSHHNNGVETAVSLKQQGHRLWALETTSNAHPLLTNQIQVVSSPITLIVGNEKAGVDPGILKLCEHIFYLPMLGRKASLNVAVAFGIAAYKLTFSA